MVGASLTTWLEIVRLFLRAVCSARSFMISSEPPPIMFTFTSR
jgi:hypothetical protein